MSDNELPIMCQSAEAFRAAVDRAKKAEQRVGELAAERDSERTDKCLAVQRVHQLDQEVSDLRANVATLVEQLDDAREDERRICVEHDERLARLTEAERERDALRGAAQKLIDELDCDVTGSCARCRELLASMLATPSTAGAAHPVVEPRDETKPPPGWQAPWSHYGCPPYLPPGPIPGKAERHQYVDVAEAWRIYDREHGYAPAPAERPPTPLPSRKRWHVSELGSDEHLAAIAERAAAERPQDAPAYSWEQRAKDAEESMDEASAKLIPLLAGHRDGFGVDNLGPFYVVRKPTDHPNYKGRHDAALDTVVDAIVERYGPQDAPRSAERDESGPAPGWTVGELADSTAEKRVIVSRAPGGRRCKTWEEAYAVTWALYDAEHGYAPHPSGTEGPHPAEKSADEQIEPWELVKPQGLVWTLRDDEDGNGYLWALTTGGEGPRVQVHTHETNALCSARNISERRILAASPPDGTAPERAPEERWRAEYALAEGELRAHLVDFGWEPEPFMRHGLQLGIKRLCDRLNDYKTSYESLATRPPDGMPGEPDEEEEPITLADLLADLECMLREADAAFANGYDYDYESEIRKTIHRFSPDSTERAAPPTVPGEPPPPTWDFVTALRSAIAEMRDETSCRKTYQLACKAMSLTPDDSTPPTPPLTPERAPLDEAAGKHIDEAIANLTLARIESPEKDCDEYIARALRHLNAARRSEGAG